MYATKPLSSPHPSHIKEVKEDSKEHEFPQNTMERISMYLKMKLGTWLSTPDVHTLISGIIIWTSSNKFKINKPILLH
jgi:hypothetical protein